EEDLGEAGAHAREQLAELGAPVVQDGPRHRRQHLGRHGHGPGGVEAGRRAHSLTMRSDWITSRIERRRSIVAGSGVLSSVSTNIASPPSETRESCMLLMFTPASPSTVPTFPTAPGLS